MVEAYNLVRAEVTAAGARLVAVTKQRPVSRLQELYAAGQRDFGENRADELVRKHAELPADVRWHFIGHLQRNKVKLIAPFVSLVHSGDSARLLRELNKQARANERTISVLLQFHVAAEQSKYGLDPATPLAVFDALPPADRTHLAIRGVMGMATFTEDEDQIRAEFTRLVDTFQTIRSSPHVDGEQFTELSMGMSGDYRIGLELGATLVRVGSALD